MDKNKVYILSAIIIIGLILIALWQKQKILNLQSKLALAEEKKISLVEESRLKESESKLNQLQSQINQLEKQRILLEESLKKSTESFNSTKKKITESDTWAHLLES
jgi:predicted nuclease with TOPRIM domain